MHLPQNGIIGVDPRPSESQPKSGTKMAYPNQVKQRRRPQLPSVLLAPGWGDQAKSLIWQEEFFLRSLAIQIVGIQQAYPATKQHPSILHLIPLAHSAMPKTAMFAQPFWPKEIRLDDIGILNKAY